MKWKSLFYTLPLPVRSSERFLPLYSNQILFTNSSITDVDCSLDTRSSCQTACVEHCQGAGMYPRPYDPYNPHLPCLALLPASCTARLRGVTDQGSTACNKVAFHYHRQAWEGLYIFALTLPVQWDGFTDTQIQLDEVHILYRMHDPTEFPDLCNPQTLLVQVTNQCAHKKDWSYNRGTPPTSGKNELDENDMFFSVNITAGYRGEMLRSSDRLTNMRYITIGEDIEAWAVGPEACLYDRKRETFIPDLSRFFGTRFIWSKEVLATTPTDGYDFRYLEDDPCTKHSQCTSCRKDDECEWCMTPAGRTCASSCGKFDQLARPLDYCGAPHTLTLSILSLTLLALLTISHQ